MAVIRSSIEVKLPRRMAWRVMMPKKISSGNPGALPRRGPLRTRYAEFSITGSEGGCTERPGFIPDEPGAPPCSPPCQLGYLGHRRRCRPNWPRPQGHARAGRCPGRGFVPGCGIRRWSTRQASFSTGAVQTVPVQPPSCQGTRTET